MKFIGYLSHELRNPIQVIVSGVQCLLESRNENKQAEEQLIKSLGASTEFVSVIINDMIDMTKLESGHMKIHETSFNLREKVEQVTNMLKTLETDNLKISYVIEKDVPEFIHTDPTKLQQILLNIMSNSCKYTHGGYVMLRCGINKTTIPMTIDFEVSDTGIGIDAEEIPKLFKMYRRLNHNMPSYVSGSGIGLCLSKLLCDVLGFSITVDSTKNVGTKFTISMNYEVKRNEIPRNLETPYLKPETSLAMKRSLIVDDNEIIRKLLKKMLHMCEIEEAENGLEAIKKCKNHKFDFIVMDMMMPVMNGMEAINILRKEMNVSIPIFALTGNSLEDEINSLLSAGATKVLLKPINRATLISEISKMFK